MGNQNLGAQSSSAPLPGSAIQDGGVGTSELSADAVTTAKLAASSVTAAKIAPDTITIAELAQSLRNFLIPIGTVLPFAGAITTPPSGFIACDGASHNTTGTCTTCGLAHSELAAVLSNTYGGTLGSTFRVPDLRGRVPMGEGTGLGDGSSGNAGSQPSGTSLSARARGRWGGAQNHTLSTAQLPAHAHGINGESPGTNDAQPRFAAWGAGAAAGTSFLVPVQPFGPGGAFNWNDWDVHSHTVNSHSHGGATQNAGSTNSHNNTQPFVVLNYIIKAI